MYGALLVSAVCAFIGLQPGGVHSDRFAAWLEQAWTDAQELPQLDGVVLRIRSTNVDQGAPGELERLRADVSGRPDHPGRRRLDSLEQTALGLPYWSVMTVRLADSNRWRINFDDSHGFFFDTALNDGVFWRFGANQLTIGEASAAPPGFEPESSLADFRQSIGFLRTGGFHLASSLGLTRDEAVSMESQGVFRFRATQQGGAVVEFAGRWSEEVGRGFIDEFRLVKIPGAAGEERMSWVMRDWKFDLTLGDWIAARVEEFAADGRPIARWELVDANLEPPERLEELLEIPRWDGADPLRDPLTVRAVADHRDSGSKMSHVEQGRLEPVSPASRTVGGIFGSVAWWWAIPPLVVLVVVRIRRVFQSSGMDDRSGL